MDTPMHDRPRTACPQCGALIEFYLKCHGVTLLNRDDPPASVQVSAASRLRPPADQALIDAAKRTNLLEPFIKTLTVAKQGAPLPHDLDGFFVVCMRTLVQRLLPPHAVQQFREAFPHGRLAYYSSQGIGAVVVNDALRLFVPNSQIMGTSLRGLGAKNKGQASARLSIDDGPAKLREWLRTRWGYVAGEGALFAAFQQQDYGSFDRPGVTRS